MQFVEKRRQARLSQKEAAKALGVERSTISKWETGVSLPRGMTLLKVAKLYSCPVDELMQGELSKEPKGYTVVEDEVLEYKAPAEREAETKGA